MLVHTTLPNVPHNPIFRTSFPTCLPGGSFSGCSRYLALPPQSLPPYQERGRCAFREISTFPLRDSLFFSPGVVVFFRFNPPSFPSLLIRRDCPRFSGVASQGGPVLLYLSPSLVLPNRYACAPRYPSTAKARFIGVSKNFPRYALSFDSPGPFLLFTLSSGSTPPRVTVLIIARVALSPFS